MVVHLISLSTCTCNAAPTPAKAPSEATAVPETVLVARQAAIPSPAAADGPAAHTTAKQLQQHAQHEMAAPQLAAAHSMDQPAALPAPPSVAPNAAAKSFEGRLQAVLLASDRAASLPSVAEPVSTGSGQAAHASMEPFPRFREPESRKLLSPSRPAGSAAAATGKAPSSPTLAPLQREPPLVPAPVQAVSMGRPATVPAPMHVQPEPHAALIPVQPARLAMPAVAAAPMPVQPQQEAAGLAPVQAITVGSPAAATAHNPVQSQQDAAAMAPVQAISLGRPAVASPPKPVQASEALLPTQVPPAPRCMLPSSKSSASRAASEGNASSAVSKGSGAGAAKSRGEEGVKAAADTACSLSAGMSRTRLAEKKLAPGGSRVWAVGGLICCHRGSLLHQLRTTTRLNNPPPRHSLQCLRNIKEQRRCQQQLRVHSLQRMLWT